MARRIAAATGNFTTAGTWGLCDTNGVVDSEAGSTAISTSALTTPNFTPGAITVDGVALKLSARAASPSGTFTVTLRNTTASLDVTSVTVNISDFNSAGNGWVFFKFSSSQLLLAATTYAIKVVCSATGSQVTLFRSATTDDYSKMLRTTTTGAPAAADQLIIVEEMTGAGTANALTVTMDNTAATVFGATTFTDSIAIGVGGTLSFGTAASTNYLLTFAGLFRCFGGGTLNVGTVGTRIPSTSTAILSLSVASNVDTGLVFAPGAIYSLYGPTITAYQTLLTADAAAAATSITVGSTTNWADGDSIGIASTTRTGTQCETRTVTVTSSTTATVSALTNAHSGTSPTQAEVIHLTRNVRIQGTSASLQGYVLFDTTSTGTVDHVEFKNLGSATASKRGVDIKTTTGSCVITGCSFHDFTVASSRAIYISIASSNNIQILNSNFYNNIAEPVTIDATTGTALTFTNLVAMLGTGFAINDLGGAWTTITQVGSTGIGFTFSESALATGSFTGCTAHSNASSGMSLALPRGTCSNPIAWRNGGAGLALTGSGASSVLVANPILFGNTTNNINASAGADCIITGGVFNGDSTFSTTNGLSLGATGTRLLSCTFGVAAGSGANARTAHTTDIVLSASIGTGDTYLNNCLLTNASPNDVSLASTVSSRGSRVTSQKHNQTVGLHKRWEKYGTAAIDTSVFNTASPSEQLTPLSATVKFESSPMRFAVASGNTATVTVQVRKSAAYNGNQPRLILRANPASGITATSDTVLATYTGGTGSFAALSAALPNAVTDDAVLEVFVDCDGTAGVVNVDDWSVA